jgi:soluble lytic murein transglycosylase-like protein
LVAEEVRQYITEFMSPISRTRQYRRRYPAALKYIPIILDLVEADMERHFPEHDPLDPLIIAVIIAYESSWDHTVIGKLGERGYMQIHGEVALYGFEEADLDDPVIQLDAGIRHWRRAVNRCPGDLRGALTLYGTGKRCRPYADFVKWRWRAYQKALESFRFGKEKTHERTEISPCAGDAQGDAQGNQ